MNWKTLFNPFEKYSEYKLLLFGILFFILTPFVSYYTQNRMTSFMRFDSPEEALTLTSSLLYCSVSIASIILILYLIALIFNRRSRFLDITNTILVSNAINIPILLLTHLIDVNKAFSSDGINENFYQYIINLLFIIVITAIVISLVIYSIVLFFNGFKTATNIKKLPQIILFVFIFFVSLMICQIFIPQLKF
ncbi:YIP1 family protein [Elizabethkingia sp. HX WHF]|nr:MULTISPECIES: YIP1 family protein [Elizabethkingia]MCL1637739.1 YIP1 family protein [Elizabethkingia bruuniana]MDX8565199.1 YIP1 family protein [Elizabethkingia sp. HX WHF]